MKNITLLLVIFVLSGCATKEQMVLMVKQRTDMYDWTCAAAPSLGFDIAAKREDVDPKEYGEYEATYSQQYAAFGG